MAVIRSIAVLCIIMVSFKTKQSVTATDCKEFGICDKVDNYPIELARRLIQELKNQNTLFNYDEKNVVIRGRGSFAESKSLCEFKEHYIPPLQAKDRNGILRYILNDKEVPVQRFRTEICNNNEASCSARIHFIPGYRGVCVQKMALREMIFVDEKRNTTGVEYFEIPTCCSCSLFFTQ